MFNKRSKFNNASNRRFKNIDRSVDSHQNTQLHKMVMSENIKEVKKLLKIGASLRTVNNNKQTPLYAAIKTRNIKIIDLLIDYGAKFDALDKNGQTPLMFAIETKCDTGFLDYLLSKGNFLYINNRMNCSVMHTAAANDNIEILEYLKNKHISIDHENKKGETPLHYAVQYNSPNALKFLIANKANVFLRTNNIESLLHLATEAENETIIEVLLLDPIIRQNINRFKNYDKGTTPLMLAIEKGNLNIVQQMLDAGADVNMKNSNNEHSLLIAVKYGYVEIAELLIKYGADLKSPIIAKINSNRGQNSYKKMLTAMHNSGADVDTADTHGNTALHAIVCYSDIEKVKLLLKLGADIEKTNHNGERPLDVAIDFSRYSRNNDITKLLLKAGANPNLSPSSALMFSPLHRSIMHSRDDVMEMLLKDKKINIDESAKNVRAFTPLLLAASYRRTHICKKLINHGADIIKTDGTGQSITHLIAGSNEIVFLTELLKNKTLKKHINMLDNKGNSPLHYASESGHTGNIIELLKNGADPMIKNKLGRTAIHCAASNGDFATIDAFKIVDTKLNIFNLRMSKTKATPLHMAAKSNRPHVVNALLELGADIEAKDAEGLSPIHLAISMDSMPTVQTMLKHLKENDINIDKIKDNDNSTLLHYAIKEDASNGLIKEILKSKPNINHRDINGDTPLSLAKEIALRTGDDNIFYLLSGKNIKNTKGFKPPKPKGL